MIASSAVQQLQARFRGELLAPGDPQYDAARTVFNGTIDRRPALIARCAGPDDVVQAVNFARDQERAGLRPWHRPQRCRLRRLR